jgi:hypothetical protein
MKNANAHMPILDIHQAAFLFLHGIEPTLTKQGTRVIFEFPNSTSVMTLLMQYNENPRVPVMDFASKLRRLRAQMLASR